MDSTDQDIAGTTCRQCRAPADAGRIFCAKCGAALRVHSSLIPSSDHDANAPPIGPMKRFVVTAIKYLAGLSAVVFWLCPLRTGTQVLLFVASIAVMLICHFGLSSIDEEYANKNADTGPNDLIGQRPPNRTTPAQNGSWRKISVSLIFAVSGNCTVIALTTPVDINFRLPAIK